MPALPRLRSHPWTKQFLLESFLFGLDLTDDARNPFPERVWKLAGTAAALWLETNLDIVVIDRGYDIVERQDYEVAAWDNWQWLSLDRTPIRRVSKVEYLYGGDTGPTKVVEVPLGWVRVEDEEAGQIQIIPNAGTMSAAFAQLFGGSIAWINVASAGSQSRIPGFYRVTYRAGFYPGYYASGIAVATTSHVPTGEIAGPILVRLDAASGEDGTKVTVTGVDLHTGQNATEDIVLGADETEGETTREWSAVTDIQLVEPGAATTWSIECAHGVPEDVMAIGGMYASMFLLNPAGDMVAGAGIASKSISVDGLSQSISTTASATNAGYGSRIIQYWNDIRAQLPALRSKYRRGGMIEVA